MERPLKARGSTPSLVRTRSPPTACVITSARWSRFSQPHWASLQDCLQGNGEHLGTGEAETQWPASLWNQPYGVPGDKARTLT